MKADKQAKAATIAAPVRITGTAMIGERRVVQQAVMLGLAAAQGQDSLAVVDSDSPLWVAVTIPTPFKFVGVFESRYIRAARVYIRKYRIERNGFEGPIAVELADRQGRHLQGVTADRVIVRPGNDEFEFAVNLPPWMEVGRTCRSTLAISGVTTDADGNSHTISYSSNDQHNQMIALVATGRLTIQLPQSTLAARPGDRVELLVQIQRSPGIAGPVQFDIVVPKAMLGVSGASLLIDGNKNAGTLVLDFANELKGIGIHPVTIRATTEDERHLPITAEAKLELVNPALVDADDLSRIHRIRVEPVSVEIRATNRFQQLLVTAERKNGQIIDVTRRVHCQSSNAKICQWKMQSAIGVSDGDTELRIKHVMASRRSYPFMSVVSVRIPPVDFANDLLPLFSKLGCNSGGCHGKASGQNGFMLSVFGFDAAADFDALVKEGRGRRLFAANPESSLLLKKATGLVPHGGGQRMKVESADYAVLEAWIRQGTPFEQAASPTLVGLSVSPE